MNIGAWILYSHVWIFLMHLSKSSEGSFDKKKVLLNRIQLHKFERAKTEKNDKEKSKNEN